MGPLDDDRDEDDLPPYKSGSMIEAIFYWILAASLVLLMLFVAGTVGATNQPDVRVYNLAQCRGLSVTASQFASNRDRKVPIADIAATVEKMLKESRNDPESFVKSEFDEQLVRGLLNVVYASKLSPIDTMATVLVTCKAYSREVKDI